MKKLPTVLFFIMQGILLSGQGEFNSPNGIRKSPTHLIEKESQLCLNDTRNSFNKENNIDHFLNRKSQTSSLPVDSSETRTEKDTSDLENQKPISYRLYSKGYRDLVVTKKGDSLICKITEEDSLKVYISLLVNENEVETFVEKDKVVFIHKNFFTLKKKSSAKAFYNREDPVKGSYLSINPCVITIGGDFTGDMFCTEEWFSGSTYINPLRHSYLIPDIDPGFGYNINFAIVRKYKHLGFGLEASFIKSKHNGSWKSYDMKVKYISLQASLSLLYMIRDDLIWKFNVTYPIDQIVVEGGEWAVTDWDNYTIEIVDDCDFENSSWDIPPKSIPLNIGSSLDFFISKHFIFFVGFDYQIRSTYSVGGLWGNHYYTNSGYEIHDMPGLSSNLLNLCVGIRLFFDAKNNWWAF